MGSITTATDISLKNLLNMQVYWRNLKKKIKQRYMIGWKK